MSQRVRYPRAVAALRIGLYLSAIVAAVMLFGVAVSLLGFVTILGSLSVLLFGDANLLAVGAVGAAGLVGVGFVATALVAIVRRVDRRLLSAARVPDPIDRVTATYVAGEIDEPELERRIERVLATDANAADGTRPRSASLRHRSERRSVETESTNGAP